MLSTEGERCRLHYH